MMWTHWMRSRWLNAVLAWSMTMPLGVSPVAASELAHNRPAGTTRFPAASDLAANLTGLSADRIREAYGLQQLSIDLAALDQPGARLPIRISQLLALDFAQGIEEIYRRWADAHGLPFETREDRAAAAEQMPLRFAIVVPSALGQEYDMTAENASDRVKAAIQRAAERTSSDLHLWWQPEVEFGGEADAPPATVSSPARSDGRSVQGSPAVGLKDLHRRSAPATVAQMQPDRINPRTQRSYSAGWLRQEMHQLVLLGLAERTAQGYQVSAAARVLSPEQVDALIQAVPELNLGTIPAGRIADVRDRVAAFLSLAIAPTTEGRTLGGALAYTQKESKFGTSGIRGVALYPFLYDSEQAAPDEMELTQLETYIDTQAFIRYLESAGEIRQGDPVTGTIVLAGDFRPTTPELRGAVVQAILDAGYLVEDIGNVPTPTLTDYAMKRGRASIMVTGSHIPANRNGVKFNRPRGEVLKPDEGGIKNAVAAARVNVYGQPFAESRFDELGRLRQAPPAQVSYEAEAIEEYIADHVAVFPGKPLAGKKVVVWQQSSVGTAIMAEILRRLGADVVVEDAIEISPDRRATHLVTVDTENITEADRAYFRELAQKHPDAFAIVSGDHDFDRPIVVDELGEFHRGDVLGIVGAQFLGVDFIAVPISANDAFYQAFEGTDVIIENTRIGSPFQIEAMMDNPGEDRFFVEVNGGAGTLDDLELPGGVLRASPTRSAARPILGALLDAAQKGLKVSERFAQVETRFTQAGLIKQFPSEVSQAVIRSASPDPNSEIVEAQFEDGQITVRRDTVVRRGEPLPERVGEAETIREALAAVFSPDLRFGRVAGIRWDDQGLLVWFTNDDEKTDPRDAVRIHVNASGAVTGLEVKSQTRQAQLDSWVADGTLRIDPSVSLRPSSESGIVRVRFGRYATTVVRINTFDASDPAASGLPAIREYLSQFFTAENKFGPVTRINWMDGIRIWFDNETHDIAHIRPSGNAPEFRIYSNSDTQARADEIVRLGLAEPDGILRSMQRVTAALQQAQAVREAVAAYNAEPVALKIRPNLKGKGEGYVWGTADFIPDMFRFDNPEGDPFGEAWLGAHPKGPAETDVTGVHMTLDQLVAGAAEALFGPEVAARFGGQHPNLTKVLSAGKMLSPQGHSNKRQAVEGYEREDALGIPLNASNRNYKDRNHKPEQAVVIGKRGLWMLHGFRPLEEVAELFDRIPEFQPIMPDFRQRLEAAGDDPALRSDLLRALFERMLGMEGPEADQIVDPALQRLRPAFRTGEMNPDTDHEYWFVRAGEEFSLKEGHRDPGLLAMFLFNLIHVKPGRSVYQPAGLPHAYLTGDIMEVMANSDNVIRLGLTVKHVDVEEAGRVLVFEESRPEISDGERISDTEVVYPAPFEEFQSSVITVSAEQAHQNDGNHSLDTLVVLDADDETVLTITLPDQVLTVTAGEAFVVPYGQPYTIESTGPAVLFKSTIPIRSIEEIQTAIEDAYRAALQEAIRDPSGKEAAVRNARTSILARVPDARLVTANARERDWYVFNVGGEQRALGVSRDGQNVLVTEASDVDVLLNGPRDPIGGRRSNPVPATSVDLSVPGVGFAAGLRNLYGAGGTGQTAATRPLARESVRATAATPRPEVMEDTPADRGFVEGDHRSRQGLTQALEVDALRTPAVTHSATRAILADLAASMGGVGTQDPAGAPGTGQGAAPLVLDLNVDLDPYIDEQEVRDYQATVLEALQGT